MEKIAPEKIGRYEIVRSLNKGGMGEVYLAYDPICKREIALKLIREDLKDYAVIKERFLREAHVASQLVHPAIITIFSIESCGDKTFYTMPYVEGQTLKQILKETYEEEKIGEIKHPIGSSIPALTRIFLVVCEAIAYTHSKKILHRDLKPDNIIIGKYGEVLILDWGLADLIGTPEEPADENGVDVDYKDLTRPGKTPGTVNYIAPERARGDPSDVTMDIYSLGVILYQLLTLRIPFSRSTIKSFRKTMHLEKLVDPLERAPYRDIPVHLADIATRCLRFNPAERFQSADEMIIELKNFLEGRAEWIPTAALKVDSVEDWEFQENILLTKHLAVTRSPDLMEWVCLMLSRASFTGNIKMEAEIALGKECNGVGFLLGIPETPELKGISEGYCVWLGKEPRLFHNDVEVIPLPPIPNERFKITVEKEEGSLSIYANATLISHYVSHLPTPGTHVGILCRDGDFEIGPIRISVGSQNATVNCLAVPDAFLANKNYAKALVEYRRIANCFAKRTEGREALFRAGITLLEEAATRKKSKEKELHYLMALDEFGKLRFTPGAPLEYLGKSLVYKATGEIEEEVKCLELCVRKFGKHPLLSIIKEQIGFRLHESAARNRIAAYHFALLALRQLPTLFANSDHAQLLSSFQKHLERVPFLISSSPEEQFISCTLAFWLFKPIPLMEILESSPSSLIGLNAAYALLGMGFHAWVKENLHLIEESREIEIALTPINKALPLLSSCSQRLQYFLLDQALLLGKSQEILPYFSQLTPNPDLDALHISALLTQKKWSEAVEIFDKYPNEVLTDDTSAFYPLFGCLLRQREGKEIALSHFSGSIDLPHPPTTMLLSYFLRGKIGEKKGWLNEAFPWEKIQLFRQLQLYYHCSGNRKKSLHYFQKMKRELYRVRSQNSYP